MPTPPPIPGPKNISPIAATSDKEAQARLRSNMLVMDGGAAAGADGRGGGGGGQSAEGRAATNAVNNSDPNRAFTAAVLASSRAERVTATRLTNLENTIGQGKIIDAVIETAVNTDLPGQIRGIVSRDVYAEAGREIMIPKGTRLIGTYNTGVSRGQARVLVVWTRLIRPDGIDMEIGSTATDQMGRAGIRGIVDNKYAEIFSAAVLTSVLSIGVAVAVDALSDQGSTTTNNANGTTQSGSAAAPAGQTAVNTIGGVGRDIVNTMLDLRPTVSLDQGTKINIFVNRDLIFPTLDNSLIQ